LRQTPLDRPKYLLLSAGTDVTMHARKSEHAFTLVEMLVSMAVLAFLVLLVTRLVNSATTITTVGHKRMDTDAQARQFLDRMAVDFDQMVKRSDISYWVKTATNPEPGNDQIAFFSVVPGYYSQAGYNSNASLVSYRVNALSTSPSYNRVERMGKGLNLNGAYTGLTPLLFLDSTTNPTTTISSVWPAATSATLSDPDGNYEVIGPQVFRFEYYYLLKNGNLTDTPWDTDAGHTSINGFADVESIGVTIAVIDPQSRSLLTSNDPNELNLLNLQLAMVDFRTAPGRGVGGTKNVIDLEYQWNRVITDPVTYPGTANMPRAALSAIRIYSRNFDLKTL